MCQGDGGEVESQGGNEGPGKNVKPPSDSQLGPGLEKEESEGVVGP